MQAGQTAEIVATNLRVLAALHRVLDILEGLPVVVFKGPLLTQRAYGHLGARASADNDLWVPDQAAEEALARLLAAGFSPATPLDPAVAIEHRGQVALWPQGDPDQVSVDLHVRPFARPYFEVDAQVLLEHLQTDTSTGRPVQTFDGPLAFCHAVAHYVQHHLPDEQLGLIRQLWSRLVNGEPDRRGKGELLALVDATCGSAAASLALWRSGELDGLGSGRREPEGRARQVAHLLAIFRGSPPGVLRKLAALYLTAPERLLSGTWDSAFPPQSLLQERYGLGPRGWLLLRHVLRVLGER